jgi:hypothetical protein
LFFRQKIEGKSIMTFNRFETEGRQSLMSPNTGVTGHTRLAALVVVVVRDRQTVLKENQWDVGVGISTETIFSASSTCEATN